EQFLGHRFHVTHRIVLGEEVVRQVTGAEVGVDLHRVQIPESVYQRWNFRELLVEGVADVVGRIGGDNEHRVANLGQLDGQGAAAGCLADATLSADKDPP